MYNPLRYKWCIICLKLSIFLLLWYAKFSFILRPYKRFESETQHKQTLNKFLDRLKILENIAQDVEPQELMLNKSYETNTLLKLIAALEKEQPSLPLLFWYQNRKNFESAMNDSCPAHYPHPSTLRYNNSYWQTFETSNITMQLYSAFYDTRVSAQMQTHVVRILAMINQTTQQGLPPVFCQLWYTESPTPLIVRVSDFRMIWLSIWGEGKNQLFPYLLSCPVPKNETNKIPQVVTLVGRTRDTATNSLRIDYTLPHTPEAKHQFAVCVKGLNFSNGDMAARLVEWIELQLLLGAHKIFFYRLETHPSINKVLDYYQRRGLVDVKPLTLAGSRPCRLAQLPQCYWHESQLLRKRLNELIPYNDCFYRNLYRYKYVVLQDIDEVIMPLGERTQWAELVTLGDHAPREERCKDGFGSYCFRNVYFPRYENRSLYSEAIPSYMYMLQHVRRCSEHTRKRFNTKCFHHTDSVLTVHNHYSMAWIKSVCRAYDFEPNVAQLQHYREPRNSVQLNNSVLDTSVWRFKDSLLQRSQQAFRELGFLTKD